MKQATSAARFDVVTDTRGKRLKDRRLKAGMSVNQLHQAAKVSRDAIDAAEVDKASDLTYAKIEAWFDAFEEEAGYDAPPVLGAPEVVTFQLKGNFGVDVVVSGPVGSLSELEETVQRLMRGMGQQSSE